MANKYYEKTQRNIEKKTRKRHQNLYEEEKGKKR